MISETGPAAAETKERPPVVDVRVFVAGTGADCSGCAVQERTLRSIPFRAMAREIGVGREEARAALEPAWKRALHAAIDGAPSVDRAVLLAHDAVFNDDGSENDVRSQLVTPNEHVWRLAATKPDRCLFGASVHPYRRGAPDLVERWVSAGAALLAWSPAVHAIDLADPRCLAVYRVLERRGAPLLAATGPDPLLRAYRSDASSPLSLRPALEAGVTVIASGCGGPALGAGSSGLDAVLRLCEAHPRLYLDTSGFCSPLRGRAALARLSDPLLASRLVHGSGFPAPTHAFWFPLRLRGRVRELESIPSPLERDVATKRALGVPDSAFTRAADLLRLGEKTRRREAIATRPPAGGG
jgi:hypothetical protein